MGSSNCNSTIFILWFSVIVLAEGVSNLHEENLPISFCSGVIMNQAGLAIEIADGLMERQRRDHISQRRTGDGHTSLQNYSAISYLRFSLVSRNTIISPVYFESWTGRKLKAVWLNSCGF